MKTFSLLMTLFLALGANPSPAKAAEDASYQGSRFLDVWDQISSDPYPSLPNNKVTYGSFFMGGVDLLAHAAKRTVESHEDILPEFNKLLHPNGICLKGTWSITEKSPYTGYFKYGSRGLIIARSSVALSETTKGNYRGFGMAGKIYPTMDRFHPDNLKTANFFVIDDLSGTMTPNYTLAEMTNEPAISFRLGSIFSLGRVALAAASALGAADKNTGIRQVYPISELGLSDSSQAITPTWMKIEGEKGVQVDEDDFRDELNMRAYPASQIKFFISVSSSKDLMGNKIWKQIGHIVFDESVASYSCDHRLHFNHAKFKDNLQ